MFIFQILIWNQNERISCFSFLSMLPLLLWPFCPLDAPPPRGCVPLKPQKLIMTPTDLTELLFDCYSVMPPTPFSSVRPEWSWSLWRWGQSPGRWGQRGRGRWDWKYSKRLLCVSSCDFCGGCDVQRRRSPGSRRCVGPCSHWRPGARAQSPLGRGALGPAGRSGAPPEDRRWTGVETELQTPGGPSSPESTEEEHGEKKP